VGPTAQPYEQRPTPGAPGPCGWPSLPGLSPAGRCPITAAAPSTVLATIQPAFTDAGRLALAGFPAGYRGLTREACALDRRQFTSWCKARSLACARSGAPTSSHSPGIWKPEAAHAPPSPGGCAPSPASAGTPSKKSSWSTRPPRTSAVPRVDYESHATALDRTELGALLVAGGLGPPAEHAPISLLALNGLRVSEATGADIEHLGLERGHRTLTITRNGGTVVTIPLAPRTARAIDLAIGERTGGPVFLAADGRPLDRHGAGPIVRKPAEPGSPRPSRPTRSGMRSSPQLIVTAYVAGAAR
jgi:integrase/recombinase XerD